MIGEQTKQKMLDLYDSGLSTHKIAKIMNYRQGFVWTTLNKIKGKLRGPTRIRSVNEDYFEIIDSEDKAYILGFITADGCITRNVKKNELRGLSFGLSSIDEGHLEKIKLCLGSNVKIRHTYKKQKSGEIGEFSHLEISCVKIARDLINLGVMPAKSMIIKPCEFIPEELQRHYWRGCVDGDGYIRSTGRVWGIGLCGNIYMVEGFKNFILKSGIPTESKIIKDRNIWQFCIGGSIINRLVGDLLWGNSSIYLDRKYKLYQEMINIPIKRIDTKNYKLWLEKVKF